MLVETISNLLFVYNNLTMNEKCNTAVSIRFAQYGAKYFPSTFGITFVFIQKLFVINLFLFFLLNENICSWIHCSCILLLNFFLSRYFCTRDSFFRAVVLVPYHTNHFCKS